MEIVAVLVAVAAGLLIIRHRPQLTVLITIAYFAALVYVTFLMRLSMTLEEGVFEPFLTGMKLIRGTKNLFEHFTLGARFSGEILDVLRGIFLNLLIFVPFGYLTPCVSKQINTRKTVVLSALCCSIFIEVTQQISKLGMLDFFDVMNNTLGALIGYGLYRSRFRC